MANELVITGNNLDEIIATSGLEKTKAQYLLDNFSEYFKIASYWQEKAKQAEIANAKLKAEQEKARLEAEKARLAHEAEVKKLQEQQEKERLAQQARFEEVQRKQRELQALLAQNQIVIGKLGDFQFGVTYKAGTPDEVVGIGDTIENAITSFCSEWLHKIGQQENETTEQ